MEKNTQQENLTSDEVRERFNQILERHMERLIGTKYGIEGLPLNLTTISCLILLAEQAANGMDEISTPTERYTQEMLLKELAEIGLDPNSDLKASIQNLFDKGYISIDATYEISVRKPTLSMAQLLDRLFPKMPGMNLVAYLIQTIDEAESGRKDPEYAINQFDQTLQIQGVPLKKEKTPPEEKRISRSPIKQKNLRKEIAPLQKANGSVSSKPRILSADGRYDNVDIKEMKFGQAFHEQKKIPESSSEISENNELSKSSALEEPDKFSETLTEIGTEPNFERSDSSEETIPVESITEDISSNPEEYISLSTPAAQETGFAEDQEQEKEPAKATRQEEASTLQEIEYSTEKVLEENVRDTTDVKIEDRIEAFEYDLAMQCPMCKVARVEETVTSKGKVYYRCADRNCNFISWGKPHHLVCPQCNNPFLVETLGRKGETVLKCPRATCRYMQKSSEEIMEDRYRKAALSSQEAYKKKATSKKPRRRVKKRRVVRRKR